MMISSSKRMLALLLIPCLAWGNCGSGISDFGSRFEIHNPKSKMSFASQALAPVPGQIRPGDPSNRFPVELAEETSREGEHIIRPADPAPASHASSGRVAGSASANAILTPQNGFLQFPDFEAIKKARKLGGWADRVLGDEMTQSTTPDDTNLLLKLGISSKDRMFVIAGFAGDWAHALAAAGAEITYTDLDPEVVHAAQAKGSQLGDEGFKRAEEYRVADPLYEPGNSTYDWTFSYEPTPLEQRELPWVLVRSLLNKKGAIFAWSTFGSPKSLAALLEALAEAYGLKGQGGEHDLEHRKIPIRVKTLIPLPLDPDYFPTEILILRTNDELRKKAELDGRLIQTLQTFDGTSMADLRAALSIKGGRCDTQLLRNSLKRISILTQLIPSENRRTLKLEPDSAAPTAPKPGAMHEGEPWQMIFLLMMFDELPYAYGTDELASFVAAQLHSWTILLPKPLKQYFQEALTRGTAFMMEQIKAWLGEGPAQLDPQIGYGLNFLARLQLRRTSSYLTVQGQKTTLLKIADWLSGNGIPVRSQMHNPEGKRQTCVLEATLYPDSSNPLYMEFEIGKHDKSFVGRRFWVNSVNLPTMGRTRYQELFPASVQYRLFESGQEANLHATLDHEVREANLCTLGYSTEDADKKASVDAKANVPLSSYRHMHPLSPSRHLPLVGASHKDLPDPLPAALEPPIVEDIRTFVNTINPLLQWIMEKESQDYPRVCALSALVGEQMLRRRFGDAIHVQYKDALIGNVTQAFLEIEAAGWFYYLSFAEGVLRMDDTLRRLRRSGDYDRFLQKYRERGLDQVVFIEIRGDREAFYKARGMVDIIHYKPSYVLESAPLYKSIRLCVAELIRQMAALEKASINPNVSDGSPADATEPRQAVIKPLQGPGRTASIFKIFGDEMWSAMPPLNRRYLESMMEYHLYGFAKPEGAGERMGGSQEISDLAKILSDVIEGINSVISEVPFVDIDLGWMKIVAGRIADAVAVVGVDRIRQSLEDYFAGVAPEPAKGWRLFIDAFLVELDQGKGRAAEGVSYRHLEDAFEAALAHRLTPGKAGVFWERFVNLFEHHMELAAKWLDSRKAKSIRKAHEVNDSDIVLVLDPVLKQATAGRVLKRTSDWLSMTNLANGNIEAAFFDRKRIWLLWREAGPDIYPSGGKDKKSPNVGNLVEKVLKAVAGAGNPSPGNQSSAKSHHSLNRATERSS